MTIDKSTVALGVVTAAALSGGAYMWWRGRQMKRPPLTEAKAPTTGTAASTTKPSSNVIWGPAGPILVKPINVSIIQRQIIEVLPAKEKNNTIFQIASSEIRPRPINNLAIAGEVLNVSKKTNGLLGRIVSYHWSMWGLRYKYMLNYNQFSAVDDTWMWWYDRKGKLYRSEKDYREWVTKASKDSSHPLYALPVSSDVRRLVIDNGMSKFDYFKSSFSLAAIQAVEDSSRGTEFRNDNRICATSLERTFSNWSRQTPLILLAPISTNDSSIQQAIKPTDKKFKPYKVLVKAPLDRLMTQMKYRPGYKDNNNYSDYGTWGSPAYGGEVWRDVDRGERLITIKDRVYDKPTPPSYTSGILTIYPIDGLTHQGIRFRIDRYFERGYFLVLAVQDILISRGKLLDGNKTWSKFNAYCNAWGVPVPKNSLQLGNPNLSMIGGVPAGLSDVTSENLVEYIMRIAPIPGSVEPWKDTGPLWGWPNQLGIIQPVEPIKEHIGTLIESKRNKANPGFTGFDLFGFIISVEASFCSAGLGSAASGVLDAAVSAATNTMADWVAPLITEVLEKLDKVLGSTAFKNIVNIFSEASGFGASVERFLGGQNMFGVAVELSERITRLDSGILNDVTECVNLAVDGTETELKRARNILNNKLDVLRDSWEWTDDAINPICGYGNELADALTKIKF
jgi:hypothetical protein